MRFKTDENVHPDVAACLQQQGHDAVTVWDESLRGTPDANLAKACQDENRALITLDLDFSDIRVYPPEQFPGLVVLRLASQSRDSVLEVIARLLPMLTEDKLTGHLWIVTERNVRVRGK
jgi:predicted nuclease of predicted toxin-antitoxin system